MLRISQYSSVSSQQSEQQYVPLKHVSVETFIKFFAADVTIKQVFRNDETKPIEAVYCFPIEEQAAIYSFIARIDDRKLIAQLKEKNETQREYSDALEQGHGAYLLEQDEKSQDNFIINVGALPAGKECHISISYVSELDLVENGSRIRFVVPTTIAPRYNPNTGDVSSPAGTTSKYVQTAPYTIEFRCQLEPLKWLEKHPPRKGRVRQIFLLTDGEISNVNEVLDLCRSMATSTRIFSFGLGHSPSRSLVKGLARATNGCFVFIPPNTSVDIHVGEQLQKALQSYISGIQVDWNLGTTVMSTPTRIPPVYANDRLIVYALANDPISHQQSLIDEEKDETWPTDNQNIIRYLISKQKFDGSWDLDAKDVEHLTGKPLRSFPASNSKQILTSAIVIVTLETRFATMSTLWYGVVQKARKRLFNLLGKDVKKLESLLENIRQQL
ncbi:unnamed protein product [Rotaria sp. Silwood1]|nr:unnamed protein product [Rotaria sp. Silwood1]CAF3473688.1 unnamed protein product [Rotaria sp. Silwood1]